MDIRGVLRSPLIYMAFQRLVGGIYARDICLRIIDLQPGERVLDIGCGPAYYLKNMPPLEYVGFDTDSRYIEYARSRFSSYGTFFCEEFGEEQAQSLGRFDCVMLMGLLHHLDDVACNRLLTLVGSVLKPYGRVVALDTIVHNDQHPFARYLAINDRGKYVRHPTEFLKLAEASFESVTGELPTAWWMPSIYWCMVLQQPLTKNRACAHH